MTSPFSPIELQLIRGSLASKTNEEIAAIIERPIEQVIEMINDITDGRADERQEKILAKRDTLPRTIKTPKHKRSPEAEQERMRRARERRELKERAAAKEKARKAEANLREVERLKRRKALEARSYKTAKRDWSQYRPVQVDHKTTILIPVNANVAKEIAKYNRNRELIKSKEAKR